jgi:phosphoglycolate phosphatase-like HAD superfamily hydrolase
VTVSPLLDGIDLVIFDKDGTLLDFHAMWGGWALELGARLEAAARRPVAPDVWAAIGFDPSSRAIAPRGPLAVATMAGVEDLVATVIRRWCPNVGAARRVVEEAWFEPDPVSTARPLADLASLFGQLRSAARRVGLATNDDREPTLATLRALGVDGLVDAIVCADDGLPVKPEPDAVLAVCERLGVAPGRAAMVGDLPVDMAMGRAAGAGRVIGVTSGLATADELGPLADVVLGSVAELLPG